MRSVSATEAKNRLGALIGEVETANESIVIEHHGRPRAVIVSASEWSTLLEERKELRRLQAWERLKALAAEVSARNADLTPEEADALADEIGNEAMRRVAERLNRRAGVG